jgi:trans-aconitate methyltransferase
MLRIIKKLKNSIENILDIFYQVLVRKITLRYGYTRLRSQLSLVGLRFVDGVNWERYHSDYEEEIKIIEKTNTVLISNDLIEIKGNKILYKNKDKNTKFLIDGHKHLYETILELNPLSVLEVGLGGGDHLYNLNKLNPDFELHGVDRSEKQLNFFNRRHPELQNVVKVECIDITQPEKGLPKTELVFTHAVLMHITEKENRFYTALEKIFQSDCDYIVLAENWTQHNFFETSIKIMEKHRNWEGANIYFNTSDIGPTVRAMIISKRKLQYSLLSDYEQLLQGRELNPH